ncbi:hypothetical protein V6N13_131870 [Hibiscus sabdariffa]
MEAEVVVPLPTAEFNFDSSCSSSYITAPSSPQHCGDNLLLFTIPTSPHDSYGGEFEEESAIGVYALATLHGESSGDNGDEVEGFLALQTGLAWVSTLVCMSFLEVLGFWRRKSGEEDGLWRGGRDRRGE